ncbi:MAG: serine/threonine-protein kinase [Pirellula sp.]|jgi:serine/threonine protein kinase
MNNESNESIPPDTTDATHAPVDPYISDSNADLEKTHIASPRLESSVGNVSPVPPNVGSRWQEVANSLVGKQLDHFRIDTLVGIGGMGAVFRGEDLRLNREVAIKAVALEGRDPEAMRRFRFEAQSAAKLDHPNIARVYYVGETPFWSYIVFEFVEGVNLRDLITRQGPLSVDHSVYLIRQVAQALQHASDRQVVHRDIKPSNIVLAQNGQAKIVDMGLARVTELDRSSNDLTASGVTLGTFDYISPEQANDPRDADVRSDLYSLGCTWYYLLTGSPPFPDGTALQKLLMHGSKMPEDPRVFRSDLSDSLIAILRKLIAKRPADRYQQPTDLIDDLQTLAVIENLEWTRTTDPRDSVYEHPVSVGRWLAPYLVAFSLLLASTLWFYVDWLRNSVASIPAPVISKSPVSVSATGSNSVSIRPDESSIISLPEDSQSIIVDSSLTQDQLETNRQLAASLEQAIERANIVSSISQIVIQSPAVVSTELLKPITQLRSQLKILSPEGKRCRIEINPAKDLRESKAWMDCGSNKIAFENCDLIWKTTDARQPLFLCRPGTQLSFDNCSLRVEYQASTIASPALPAIVQFEQSSNVGVGASDPITVASSRLLLRKTTVFGNIDFLRYASPMRVETQWTNSLIAINGSVVSIPRLNIANRPSANIRMDLESVTTWTTKSWIETSWSSSMLTPIPIVRTARKSVFAGMETLVVWDVSAKEDWQFWDQTKQGLELSRWIDFRGEDNIYDESIRKLVEASLSNGMTEQLVFSADAKLLSEERGLEFSIPWKKKPTPEAISSPTISTSLFQLQDSTFPRGAAVSDLPTPSK